MSVGKKEQVAGSYLTSRRELRSAVTVSDPAGAPNLDAGGAQLNSIEMHVDPDTGIRGANGGMQFNVASHGHDACLELYVIAATGATATVVLWVWGGTEPFPSTEEARTDYWCHVHSQPITQSTLISLSALPAAPYRVTLENVTGGAITVVEQHTA